MRLSPTALDRLLLLGSGVLAFALRFLTFPGLTAEGIRLVSMDDYGHLRRAVATLRNFPHVPVFDPYLNHPEGGLWIWPPLFDLLIAALSGLLFGSQAEVEEVTLVAATLPPLFGVLTLPLLFFLAHRVLGRAEARVAVVLYASLPAAVAWSSFGHADQHAGEAFVFVLVLALASTLLRRGSNGAAPMRVFGPGWGEVLGLALATAGAVWMWQGGVFLAPVLAAAAFAGSHARRLGAALLLAAALILVVALPHPGPITYVSFGLFQPIFLGLVGGLLLLSTLPRWGIPLAAGMGVLALVAWPPLWNGVAHLFSATRGAQIEAGGYLLYPAAWLELIAEYRPLLEGGPGRALQQLSAGVLLLPLIVAQWAVWARSRPVDRRVLLLLVLTSSVVTVMALSQRRYAYYLVVLVALALAGAAIWLGRRLGWPAAAVLVLLAMVPTMPAFRDLTRSRGAAGSDVFRTLGELALLDPPATDPFAPGLVRAGEVPGVLAPWSLGHLVTLVARRPAVADPLGYGFLRQSQILTAPPELDSQVERSLRDWNCRYLITTHLRAVLPRYARAVNRSHVATERMLAVRVHESPELRPLPFLRLVLVSQTGWVDPSGRWVPRLKVYRVVAPLPGEGQ